LGSTGGAFHTGGGAFSLTRILFGGGSTGGALHTGGGGLASGHGRGGGCLKGSGGFPLGRGGGCLKGSSEDCPMLVITLSPCI
jgi:hypothetical protein